MALSPRRSLAGEIVVEDGIPLHAQVGEQQGHRFGLHAGAAVGVQGQLAGADALLGTGRAAELFGQGGGLAGRDYPADGVSSPSASIGTERRCPPRVSRLQQ